jgi:arabinose-5-phosphate isomerase
MTRTPRVARVGELASAAVHRMEQGPGGVMALPVVDDRGVLNGIVHLHDLLRSGAV